MHSALRTLLEQLNGFIRTTAVAWLVLALSLGATWLAWYSIQQQINESRAQNFAQQSKELRDAIIDRMRVYEQVLNGARGLFTSSLHVDRKEFKAYVENLNVDSLYPGIQGIGYSQVVMPELLESHIESIRNEGFPDYTLHPAGERNQYTATIYLEPFNWRNRRAFGYDMFVEPVRSVAMARARDTGRTSISGKITLLQETDDSAQPGFIMFLPHYSNQYGLETIEDRREALLGYVFSPFRMYDLIEAVVGNLKSKPLFTIHDGGILQPGNELYASKPDIQANTESQYNLLSLVLPVNINGHTWTLTTYGSDSYLSMSDKYSAWITLITGVLLSLLLFAYLRQLNIRHTDAQLQLYRIENRHEQLLNSAGEGIYGVDFNGLCTFINPAATRMLGWQLEDILGKSAHDLFHHSYADNSPYPLEKCPIYAAFTDGEIHDIDDEVFWRKDGTRFPVEYTSTPVYEDDRIIGAVITFQDITQRRQAEKALLKSEEYQRAILDNIDEVVCLVRQSRHNPMHTYAEFVTPQAEALTGYPPDEFIKNPKLLYTLIHRDDIPAVKAALAGLLTSMKTVSTEYRIRHRNTGEYRWLENRIIPRVTHLDEPRTFIGVARDITNRKNNESILAQQTEELKRSNEELQHFAFVSSHDLQEPLRKIQAFSDRLINRERDRLSDTGKDHLKRLNSAASRMRMLIDDLLNYSRISRQKGDKTMVDLNVIVSEVITSLNEVIQESGATIDVSALPAIPANNLQIFQLFQNLISNSIKFHREGVPPVITIYADTVPRGEGRIPSGDTHTCRITIMDNGIGFEDKYAERIFTPFERLHSSQEYQGTGIGLAICKKVIERHGGDIQVQSTPGSGSIFTIILPLKHISSRTAA